MSKPEIPTPPKVTLEDLLQWKRAEHPAPEFWTKFEQDLRQKQLAALVEKPKWWHGLPQAFGRFGRYSVAVGATAALAVSFVALRSSGYLAIFQNDAAVADHGVAQKTIKGSSTAAAHPAVVASIAVAQSIPVSLSQEGADSVEQTSPSLAPTQIAGMIPWVGGAIQTTTNGALELSPSARSIAANLAALEESDPQLVNGLGHVHAYGARTQLAAMQSASEPESLPSTAAAFSESRRARMAAYRETAPDAFEPEPTAPAHVRERITRYLADGAWDHEVSRLGARGDRLSIKF